MPTDDPHSSVSSPPSSASSSSALSSHSTTHPPSASNTSANEPQASTSSVTATQPTPPPPPTSQPSTTTNATNTSTVQPTISTTSANATTTSTVTAKPKSKAPRPRSRSPSPVLPPPPPPLQTIRLEFTLGGPSNYEVDIAQRARETGQRPPTPVGVLNGLGQGEKRRNMDTSDSEPEPPQDDDEGEGAGGGAGKRKKRKRKSAAHDYYDVDDPFIDDSELAIDERTFFAQTKQKGFYVSSGEVALLRDKSSPKKPKSILPTGLQTATSKAKASTQFHAPGTSARAAAAAEKAAAAAAEAASAPPSAASKLGISVGAPVRLSVLLRVSKAPDSDSSAVQSTNGERNGHGVVDKNGNPVEVISIDDESVSVSVGSTSGSRRPSAGVMDVDNMDVDDPSSSSASISTARPSAAGPSGTHHPSASISTAGPGPSTGGTQTPHSRSPRVQLRQLFIPDDIEIPEKREKRYNVVVDSSGKKKKVVDLASFSDEVREDAERMKRLVDQVNWEKGKFPSHLKAPLVEMAIRAIKLDEYDEHFFNLLPTIFMYNRFTMSKLTKRQVFPHHLEILQDAQDTLLALLAKETQEGLPRAKEEYEKAKAAWDKKQEKLKSEALTSSTAGAADAAVHSEDPASAAQSESEMDVDGGGGGGGKASKPSASTAGAAPSSTQGPTSTQGGGGGGGGGKQIFAVPGGNGIPTTNPPIKKYRMTEAIKGIVWQLVSLSNECVALENEKNRLEQNSTIVSEQGARKVLYQKIVAAFPDGWMTSSQVSRDVSAMKKRTEKEQLESADTPAE